MNINLIENNQPTRLTALETIAGLIDTYLALKRANEHLPLVSKKPSFFSAAPKQCGSPLNQANRMIINNFMSMSEPQIFLPMEITTVEIAIHYLRCFTSNLILETRNDQVLTHQEAERFASIMTFIADQVSNPLAELHSFSGEHLPYNREHEVSTGTCVIL